MDNQAYLNEISASVRAQKPQKMGFMKSPIFKVAAIGLVGLLVLAILGAILSSGKGSAEKQSTELLLQINNTSSVISNYQSSLKSSDLRSASASLNSVLSNTSRDLTSYMTDKFNYKEKSVDKDLVQDATLHKDELESSLFNARINGVLDRIYAHKMSYEISLILSREASLNSASKDAALREIISNSYSSLENLHSLFDDFSETK